MNVEIFCDSQLVSKRDANIRALSKKTVCLFGAGFYSREIEDLLSTYGVTVSCRIVDEEYKNENTLTIKQASERYGNFSCIPAICANPEELRHKIESSGLVRREDIHLIDCRFWREFAGIRDPEKIETLRSLHDQLSDDISRQTLRSFVNAKLTHYIDDLPTLRVLPQYFPACLPQFTPHKDDVIVDAGAFDGDTIRAMLTLMGEDFKPKEYHAFEPDQKNFAKLLEYSTLTGKDFIRPYNSGLWSQDTSLSFAGEGTTRSAVTVAGKATTRVIDLDQLKLKPTLIKMDIEGAEQNAILGAAETIRQYKPNLAITVYHSLDDLVSIPRLIKSLSADYRFFLRAHANYTEELVLYATNRKQFI
jgi:FkbM family methyltransferase